MEDQVEKKLRKIYRGQRKHCKWKYFIVQSNSFSKRTILRTEYIL